MFTKKPVGPPTIEERLNAAAAKREAALSVFRETVTDLDAAAEEANEVREFALAQAADLISLANEAQTEQERATATALDLRRIYGL